MRNVKEPPPKVYEYELPGGWKVLAGKTNEDNDLLSLKGGATVTIDAMGCQREIADKSQRVAITVPNPLVNVSNGRLRSTTPNPDGTTTYAWFVTSPINNYNIAVNAGRYAHFSDTLAGEGGQLTLDY